MPEVTRLSQYKHAKNMRWQDLEETWCLLRTIQVLIFLGLKFCSLQNFSSLVLFLGVKFYGGFSGGTRVWSKVHFENAMAMDGSYMFEYIAVDGKRLGHSVIFCSSFTCSRYKCLYKAMILQACFAHDTLYTRINLYGNIITIGKSCAKTAGTTTYLVVGQTNLIF